MYRSLFTFAFASLACAKFIIQDSPVSTENPIRYPGKDDLITIGEPCEITWTNTTEGEVNIYLLHGPAINVEHLMDIAIGVPNNGSFYWDLVPRNLQPASSGYGIRLDKSVGGESTSVYQYSTQFGMKKSEKEEPTTPTSSSSTESSPVPGPTDAPIINPNNYRYGKNSSSTIVYSTHYQTVTSCDCESTGVPPSSTAYPPIPTVTGTSGHYNSTTNETFVPPKVAYEDGAAQIKAGGALIAVAAGIVIFFL